jgi:hypothetical protein
MDSPRLDRPHRGIAAREVLDARARAWAYVFQCWQEKQDAAGVTSTNGDDAMKGSRHDRARNIIPKRS